jgi:peptidoglycan/LPS O-acetylase OafA/YrhL
LRTETSRYYRPELDVLRFLAFLLVFWVHRSDLAPTDRVAHPWLYELTLVGVFGVPVFFLLSAFLIGELLMREREQTGTVHVAAFYMRRVLRIWPLYIAVFCGLALLSLVVPHAGSASPGVWLAFMLFAGNWWITFNGWIEYPLNPLWSISVEEQFYLAVPFLMRMGSRALVIACSVCLAVAYLTIAYYAPLSTTGRGGLWTNSLMQFQFFAAGILLAIFLKGRVPQWHPLLRVVGIAAAVTCWVIAGAVFGVRADDPHTTLGGALAGWLLVMAGVLLLFFSLLGTPARFLPAPLVYLGRISFGLYVFHITMYWFVYHVWKDAIIGYLTRIHLEGWYVQIGFMLAFAMTVTIAAASYHFFERPFLRLKERFTYIASSDAREVP